MVEPEVAAAAEPRDTRVAVVLAFAAMVAAGLAAGATLLSTSAGDEWQRSVRAEVRESAYVVNDTITAYDEVPFAEEAAIHAFAAAAEKQRLAGPTLADRYVLFLSHAIDEQASHVPKNQRPWVRGDHSYATQVRIADLRRHDPHDKPMPEELLRAGDDRAHRAWLTSLAIIPAASGFLAGALAQAFRRIRVPMLLLAALLVAAAVLAGFLIQVVA